MKKITALANLALLFGMSQLPANAVQLVVPAYFAPSPAGLRPALTPNGTADWNTLIAAQQAQSANNQAPIVAIVNPNTGAGTVGDRAYYLDVYTRFAGAGGTLIGYIPSAYVGQPEFVNPDASCQAITVPGIVGCAQAYRDLYGSIISGIFVDELGIRANTRPNLTTADVTNFYTGIYDGIKNIDANWTVFGNPGSNVTRESQLLREGSRGGANTLITYEDVARNYSANRPSDYVNSFPSSTFGNFVLEAPRSDLQNIINTAVSRNVGYIFVTDDDLSDGNPYDRLPTYFADELRIINNINGVQPVAQQVPEPDAWPMAIIGVGSILAIRYRKRFSAKG